MWKIIGKTLNPNKDKSQNAINRLLIDGKNITDNRNIAECMNNFFCTVGKNLAKKLAKPRTAFCDYLKQLKKPKFAMTFFSEVI